jgi:hypothetical protein
MGTMFNRIIGEFSVQSTRFLYETLHESKAINETGKSIMCLLARIGHLVFWDSKTDSMVLFGGQM